MAGGPLAVTPPADQTATAGVTDSFPLGQFEDPGSPGPWTVTVDWGDGSPPETFTVTAPGDIGNRPHTFADPGLFTVTVTVTNPAGGTGSAAFAVDVAAPDPPAPSAPPPGRGGRSSVGAGVGGAPHVKVYNPDGSLRMSFFAYDPSVPRRGDGGPGDVTGDGAHDIVTGAGPGGGPHVKVFDGVTGAEIRSFFAYDPAFRGGVFAWPPATWTATGSPTSSPGPGPGGGPHVKVFERPDRGRAAELLRLRPVVPRRGGGGGRRTSTATGGPTSSPGPARAAARTSRCSTARPGPSSAASSPTTRCSRGGCSSRPGTWTATGRPTSSPGPGRRRRRTSRCSTTA